MAESVAKAKTELRVLLEALGHTFIDRPYRRPVADQPCWKVECESCGREWWLRFQKSPSARGDRNVASFPQLGERCAKASGWKPIVTEAILRVDEQVRKVERKVAGG